ncbi:hypothetical protein [Congregibacter litoralis]|uniref:Uncharacterized protein n=1 Tax=Congregibacter litoralis KT71 TaxID=314285 RepID=A4AAX3_9GAMM|nr:hypothetical protein [Congregibacter litoralis]EAQ96845.2 hypothetical protein KT71_11109 [Congregibacter litoralis KT71]
MHKDYSSEGLLAFLREATLAGRMAPALARSRRAAARVLFAELTEGEAADLRQLSIDALKSRLLNIQGDGLRREVVELYAERLQGALDDYFRFVEAPDSFVSKAVPQAASPRDKQSTKTREERALETVRLSAPGQRPDVIPIPLNKDRVVYLHGIPADLTPKEARKISRVVEALADDAEVDK